MSAPATPMETQLLPNTQPIYCQFQAFCRGGIARYQLARGPARNLWAPLCDKCARSMVRQMDDGLLILAVQVAHERGLVAKALAGVSGIALQLMQDEARPPQTPTREAVLAYLEAHADDEELLAAVATLLGGSEEEDQPTPPSSAPTPAPVQVAPPAAPASKATTPAKPATPKPKKKKTAARK